MKSSIVIAYGVQISPRGERAHTLLLAGQRILLVDQIIASSRRLRMGSGDARPGAVPWENSRPFGTGCTLGSIAIPAASAAIPR